MTNCHNSLCAGWHHQSDDHAFDLSIKYGGIYVPTNQAVIHQYARECLAPAGMILGSDSTLRPYGCMGIGEGGEVVKQLLKTPTMCPPRSGLVYLGLLERQPSGRGPCPGSRN